MRILFAGLKEEFEAVFQSLSLNQGVSVEFASQCGTSNLSSAQENKYDWIIVNGNERAMDWKKRLGAVQLGHYEEGFSQELDQHAEGSKCGVTWSPSGVLQLHCKRRSTFKNTKSSTGVIEEALGSCNIFEYQRPCTKKL